MTIRGAGLGGGQGETVGQGPRLADHVRRAIGAVAVNLRAPLGAQAPGNGLAGGREATVHKDDSGPVCGVAR